MGADVVPLPVKGAQGIHNKARPQDGKALGKGLARQKTQGLALASMQAKTHLRAGQSQTGQPILSAPELCCGGL